LKKALSSAEFYLVALVTAALWFCIGGFIQNQRNASGRVSSRCSPKRATFRGLFFLFGLLGKLLFGYLGDKFSVKKNNAD
jgi:hypothetical protein